MNLLFLLLLVFPVVIGASYNLVWLYGVIGALAWYQICISLMATAKGRWPMRVLLLLGTSVYVLASWGFASSLYTQGVGFNEQFFFHLDGKTFRIAREQYGVPYFGALLIGLVTVLMPLLIKGLKSQSRYLVYQPLLWLVLILGLSPVHSLAYFVKDQSTQASMPTLALFDAPEITVLPLSIKPKNLIFIYLESVEQLYFDEKLYPQLLPNLSRLRQQAHSYTNLKQVKGTGFTMAGIVASQCGVPLNTNVIGSGNTALGSVKKPLPDYVCMGDILKAYGYQNVMYKGASLSFSGARNFFNAHGFENAKGKDYWEKNLGDVATTGWGIYDDTLFEQSLMTVEELHRSESPFAFSLVTLDTHHPDGHASASCPEYIHSEDTLLNALHCTDYLVDKFVKDIEQRGILDDAVLVVFSDHLAMRNTQWSVLQEHQEKRRLSFFVMNNEEPSLFDDPATHFDIAPTVLDYMGVPGYSALNAGVSLREGGPGSWFQHGSDAKRLARSAVFTGRNVSLKEGFAIGYKNRSITIEGLEFNANVRGHKLRKNSVYGIVFDRLGNYEGVVSYRSLNELQKHSDKLLVLLSRNPAIAELDANYSADMTIDGKGGLYLFVGYIGGAAMVKNIWWDVTMNADDVRRFINDSVASN